MNEDEIGPVAGAGAPRALDLRLRQAAARAGDLRPRPPPRAALHDRAAVQRDRPAHGLRARHRRRGDAARAGGLHGRAAARRAAAAGGRRPAAALVHVRRGLRRGGRADGRAPGRLPRARSSTSATPPTTSASPSWPSCSGAPTARRCRARAGCGIRSVSAPRRSTAPGYDDCEERIPDIGKAERLLGWRPQRTPLRDVARHRRRLPRALRRRVAAAGGAAGGQRRAMSLRRRHARLQRRPPPARRASSGCWRVAARAWRGSCVVDDGSRDDTRAQVARSLAGDRSPGRCWSPPRNGGYGAAMKDGLAAARLRAPRSWPASTPTASTAPRCWRALVARAARRAASTCCRARASPRARRWPAACRSTSTPANAVLNGSRTATLRLCADRLPQRLPGLRPARARRSSPLRGSRDSFDFDLEVIASARARRAVASGEAPIPTHYGDEISHLQADRPTACACCACSGATGEATMIRREPSASIACRPRHFSYGRVR